MKTFLSKYLVTILATLLISAPSYAVTPYKWTGDVSISFLKGSSALSDSSKIQLARHLQRINALNLEVIIIAAAGDHVESKSNKSRELSLAKARAESIRQFFLNAGYPEQLIYDETKHPASPWVSGPSPGTSRVLYIGFCKPGYLDICNENP